MHTVWSKGHLTAAAGLRSVKMFANASTSAPREQFSAFCGSAVGPGAVDKEDL
jgi:hypothetical protein